MLAMFIFGENCDEYFVKRTQNINVKKKYWMSRLSNMYDLQNISENQSFDNISLFIKEILGDSQINNESLYFFTTIYSLFLVVGFCGNLCTCIVILTNDYMRTATNVYLFNLAVADIATLTIGRRFYYSHFIANSI
jgi:hypothetical protein